METRDGAGVNKQIRREHCLYFMQYVSVFQSFFHAIFVCPRLILERGWVQCEHSFFTMVSPEKPKAYEASYFV